MRRLILGLDPGLARTGWGVIVADGNRLAHVAHGAIATAAAAPMAERLVALHDGVVEVLNRHAPHEIAIEEVFLNRNPQSTLKLGHARGVIMVAASCTGLPLAEHATKMVKKALTGTGSAEKQQVAAMVMRLLPGCGDVAADEADALAVAIAHSHLSATRNRLRVA